jgi:hypothetical protein
MLELIKKAFARHNSAPAPTAPPLQAGAAAEDETSNPQAVRPAKVVRVVRGRKLYHYQPKQAGKDAVNLGTI